MTHQLEPKDSFRAQAPRAAVAAPSAEKADPPEHQHRKYLIAFVIVLMVLVGGAIIATFTVAQSGTKPSAAPSQQRLGLASAGASSVAFQVGGASTGPTKANQLLSSTGAPMDPVSPLRTGPLAVHGILP
ncbi:MAG TPA: hypothetical protein VLC50_07085 [Actinomycetes bacterium]|nr:hypothetical protein [Actinomycetes bacterium]